MNSEFLSIENARKLKEYDKMLETIETLDKRNNELNRKVIDLEEQLENKAYKELLTQLQAYKKIIGKTIEYIETHSEESKLNLIGIPKCLIFKGVVEDLLKILKGE